MSAAGGGKSGPGSPGGINPAIRWGENRGGPAISWGEASGEYIPYGNGGTTPWSPYANRQPTAAPVDQTQLYDNAPAPGFGPTPMPTPGMPGGKSGMIGNIGGRIGNDISKFMETAIPGAGAPTRNAINNSITNRLPGQPLPPGVSKGFGLPVPQEQETGEPYFDPNYNFWDQFNYDGTGDGGGDDFTSPEDDPNNMMGGLKVGGPEMIGGAVGQPIMNPPAQTAPTPAPNQYTPSFAPGSTTPQGNAMNNINQPAWTQGRNVTKRPDGLWQDDKGYLLDNYTGSTVGTVRGHQGWLNKQAQFKARDAGMNPGGGFQPQIDPMDRFQNGGLPDRADGLDPYS